MIMQGIGVKNLKQAFLSFFSKLFNSITEQLDVLASEEKRLIR
jgi:hypothetical protein